MQKNNFKHTVPLAPLKIAALGNCKELGEKINQALANRRKAAPSDVGSPPFIKTDCKQDN